MNEFALISRYFDWPNATVDLGVGDDCALFTPTPGMQLAVSSDMLVAGQHFFHNVDPYTLGHKALAVNLSDLAACGARPLGFTLALALPEVDEAWLAKFSRGLFALSERHQCPLIGGDTTRGPLTISITVLGQVPTGQALLRSGARVGDAIYVTGTLGDARCALEALRQPDAPAAWSDLRARLETPTPRVKLAQALRGLAHAAIDLSDGLTGDLNHILQASGVGARIETAYLPRSSSDVPLSYALAGGDDYELLFTAPSDTRAALAELAAQHQTPITRIGQIETSPGLRLYNAQGQAMSEKDFPAFQHFTA